MHITPSQLFAALSHETRLRCLLLLQAHPELCVCELTAVIGAPQPHMSRHLAQLREFGLVADRRDGHWIHCRIHPGLPDWATEVLAATRRTVGATPPYAQDAQAVIGLRGQGNATRCA